MALTQVKAAGIAADAIDETKLADNSIDSEHYNDGSIDTAHIATDAINYQLIADNTIGLNHIQHGTDGQILTFDANGAPVYVGPGTDGQVLTSTGAGSPPAFEAVPAGGATINNATANELVTVASTTTQLDAEANLTFDGHHLTQNIDANAEGFNQTAAGAHYIDNTAEANLSSGDNPILRTTATWNGTAVAQIKYMAGTDTTNKDDGYITFNTSSADNLSEKMRIKSSGEVAIGSIDTPAAVRGALGIKGSNDAQSVGIAVYMQEVSGGEGYGIGVDGDGDLNIYNGGSTTPTLEILDNNNVEITDGDLIIGTAGHGIDFSAASDAAGMTSELLDDYEEGTWTPADGGGIVSFANQDGTYVKVGNMVMASFRLICTTSVTNTGSAYIVGLPFTSINSATPGGMAVSYTNSTDDFRTCHVNQNTSQANLYKHTGANMTRAQMWDGASTSKQLSGTLCYLTD